VSHRLVSITYRDQIDHLFCQVEGVEPSEDPVLQSRLFSYPGTPHLASRYNHSDEFIYLTDAQRYRLGVNYQTIPVRNAA